MIKRIIEWRVRRAKKRAIKALEQEKSSEKRLAETDASCDAPNAAFHWNCANSRCEEIDQLIEALKVSADDNGKSRLLEIIVRAAI